MSQMLYYLCEMLIVAVPAAIVFSCFWPYRRRALSAMKLRTNLWRETGLIFFVMCLFGVLAVTLWPVYMRQPHSGVAGNIILIVDRPNPLYNVNLIPFRMFSDYFQDIKGGNYLFTVINFFGNLAVFVPLGLFPALLWRNATWKRSCLVGVGVSFLVECGQYLVVRSVDIDDIILNTLGAMCGYWIYLFLRRLFPKLISKLICKNLEVPYGQQTGDQTAS